MTKKAATLEGFYSSKAWLKCRNAVIADCLARDGALYCSECGKEILGAGEAILHHVTPLNENTVGDPDIAFNPDNLVIVCRNCHNAEHEKGVAVSREKTIYIVYGGTNSQREHYIYKHASDGSLVVSIPRIQRALSPRRPRGRVLPVVWRVRDVLMDALERRWGQWTDAWVAGEFANDAEREALARRIGATCIDIEKAENAEKTEMEAEQ